MAISFLPSAQHKKEKRMHGKKSGYFRKRRTSANGQQGVSYDILDLVEEIAQEYEDELNASFGSLVEGFKLSEIIRALAVMSEEKVAQFLEARYFAAIRKMANTILSLQAQVESLTEEKAQALEEMLAVFDRIPLLEYFCEMTDQPPEVLQPGLISQSHKVAQQIAQAISEREEYVKMCSSTVAKYEGLAKSQQMKFEQLQNKARELQLNLQANKEDKLNTHLQRCSRIESEYEAFVIGRQMLFDLEGEIGAMRNELENLTLNIRERQALLRSYQAVMKDYCADAKTESLFPRVSVAQQEPNLYFICPELNYEELSRLLSEVKARITEEQSLLQEALHEEEKSRQTKESEEAGELPVPEVIAALSGIALVTSSRSSSKKRSGSRSFKYLFSFGVSAGVFSEDQREAARAELSEHMRQSGKHCFVDAGKASKGGHALFRLTLYGTSVGRKWRNSQPEKITELLKNARQQLLKNRAQMRAEYLKKRETQKKEGDESTETNAMS